MAAIIWLMLIGTAAASVSKDCSCSNYIGTNGYGQCKKSFQGSLICFIKLPSTCTDRVEDSPSNPGKWYSAKACSEPEPVAVTMSRLRKDLFKNYDKHVIPVKDQSKGVDLAFTLALIDIDMENDGTVVMDAWVRAVWNDFRLSWNPADYNGVKVLKLSAGETWIPDMSFYNKKGLEEGYGNMHFLGNTDINLILSDDGEILYIPPVTFKSHCFNESRFGIQKNWPWGEHECSFKFGSWTYDGNNINLTKYNNIGFVDMSDFRKGPVRILNNTLTRNEKFYACCDEPYLDITATLTLQKLYRVEQSGIVTYNPFIDAEIGHPDYAKLYK